MRAQKNSREWKRAREEGRRRDAFGAKALVVLVLLFTFCTIKDGSRSLRRWEELVETSIPWNTAEADNHQRQQGESVSPHHCQMQLESMNLFDRESAIENTLQKSELKSSMRND